jgi:hypothetical protein
VLCVDNLYSGTKDNLLDLAGHSQFEPVVCAHKLEHWLCHVPRERFLFLRSEDDYADQNATATQVFQFVGAPPFAVP